jgi:hypothetical protein
MSEGWVCPVCRAGVHPDVKRCTHGDGDAPVPYTIPAPVMPWPAIAPVPVPPYTVEPSTTGTPFPQPPYTTTAIGGHAGSEFDPTNTG